MSTSIYPSITLPRRNLLSQVRNNNGSLLPTRGALASLCELLYLRSFHADQELIALGKAGVEEIWRRSIHTASGGTLVQGRSCIGGNATRPTGDVSPASCF
jgi:hypothetical protein